MKEKKVMILHAVPTNNGDAALVMAVHDKFKSMGCTVKIETYDYNLIKKLYPELTFIKSIFDNKYIRHLGICNYLLIPILLLLRSKDYLDSDVFVAAPGGYVNSYYGFFNKIYMMFILKILFKKKVIMYSQSVGPLNKKDEKILKRFIKYFDVFMVRDKFSYELVKQYPNVIQTNDAAFLLSPLQSLVNNSKMIAISVREWNHDGRDKQDYIDLIKSMTYKCIDNGYKVEFVSTCQGISNYVDDSKIAKEILMSCEEKYRKSIIVNDQYMSLPELRKYIQKFDFVIGTRLHMCILSCLSGVPAFNISYEVKGKECYKILQLEEFSIDYNDNRESSLEKLQTFINQNRSLKKIFGEKAKEMNNLANEGFNYMFKNI